MLDRLNPVALISGAATGTGAACARALARHAEGGLVLADRDEAALGATADALEQPPERVSTLAFDAADAARWTQAITFIRAQYGRLDWAVVNATPPAAKTELLQWPAPSPLDNAVRAVGALMPLMRSNLQGGAIVIAAPATTIRAEAGVRAKNGGKPGLVQMVRAAAQEGAPDNIRVNAIALGESGAAAWRDAPLFQDLIRERGGDEEALQALAKLAAPLARFAGNDIARLLPLLLSDATPLSGVTMVIDAAHAI